MRKTLAFALQTAIFPHFAYQVICEPEVDSTWVIRFQSIGKVSPSLTFVLAYLMFLNVLLGLDRWLLHTQNECKSTYIGTIMKIITTNIYYTHT